MREIVTIQVGDFANYVGSHFWNFQDELLGLVEDQHGESIYKNSSLDMDILYRVGETQQGIFTYSPRMISIGSQGSLGSLNCTGSLIDAVPSSDTSDIITWTGNVSKQVAEPYKKNLFLQSLCEEEQKGTVSASNTVKERRVRDKDLVECLESAVQYWTDFSKVQYHTRSLYELHGSWTDVQKFDNYGARKDVLSEGSQKEEMNERLRFFVEECDHIQGIQLIVDDSGGFSSVAEDYLEHITDEYANTPVLLYSVRDPRAYTGSISRKESISRALHDAVSFSRLSSSCKLMGLYSAFQGKLSTSLRLKDQKAYHCSAVFAASIHSISIPFRMEMLGPTTNSAYVSGAMDIDEMIHMLAHQARQNKMSILDVALPAPSLSDEWNQGSILRTLHSLTPEIKEDDDDFHAVESLIVHGALHSGCRRASIPQVKDSICTEYENRHSKPMFSHLSVALCPLPIPLAFSSIFASHVSKHGELLGYPTEGSPSKGSLEIESIPMAARLRSSSAIVPFIEKRLGNLRKYGIEGGDLGAELLRSWGFERDEIEDMGEGLSQMLTVFNPYLETSSDSDKSCVRNISYTML